MTRERELNREEILFRRHHAKMSLDFADNHSPDERKRELLKQEVILCDMALRSLEQAGPDIDKVPDVCENLGRNQTDPADMLDRIFTGAGVCPNCGFNLPDLAAPSAEAREEEK